MALLDVRCMSSAPMVYSVETMIMIIVLDLERVIAIYPGGKHAPWDRAA